MSLLAVSMLVRVSCMELCYFASVRASNNARTQLVVSVFRAAIVGCEGAGKASRGKLTNLMATDADRIGSAGALTWTIAQCMLPASTLPASTLPASM